MSEPVTVPVFWSLRTRVHRVVCTGGPARRAPRPHLTQLPPARGGESIVTSERVDVIRVSRNITVLLNIPWIK